MSDDILRALGQSLVELDEARVAELTSEALSGGVEPVAIIQQGLTPGMAEVGRLFEEGEYYLPELLIAAEAFKAAVELVKPHLGEAMATKGTVVLGTVEGDIHDIGKNIVCLMLKNHGFVVHDLGKDVPAGRIVDEAQASGAKVIGLSALMTTTMVRMEDTIRLLAERGLEIPVMIGGAVVTEHFAQAIGAAGHSTDAVSAVRLAKRLAGTLQ